jgi:hypothetical protein
MASKKSGTTGESQRTASAQRDAEFFAERRARDAANLEKTLKLRALRLAHEATLPPKAAKPARKSKAKSG